MNIIGFQVTPLPYSGGKAIEDSCWTADSCGHVHDSVDVELGDAMSELELRAAFAEMCLESAEMSE